MTPTHHAPSSLSRTAASLLRAGAVLSLFAGCASSDSAGVKPSATRPPASAGSAGSLDRDLYNRVNAYRKSKGLPALTWNGEMSRVAYAHTQFMVSKNKLSHDGYGSRVSKLQRSGMLTATENVAYNKGKSDPVEAALNGWINSSGHKKNMSNRSDTMTGVAAAKSSEGYYFFTQLYGR